MDQAWPYGFSPRLGAVYSLNSDTVLRASVARTFGSVKNTGGSSHWNGFIGGYNVTAPAFPASSAFNWDQGWPDWPAPPFLVPNTLNGSNIPYWQQDDSGVFPSTTRGRSTCSGSCRGASSWKPATTRSSAGT